MDLDLNALDKTSYLENQTTLPEGEYKIRIGATDYRMSVTHSYRLPAFPDSTDSPLRKWRRTPDRPSSEGDRPGSCIVQMWLPKNGVEQWVRVAWLTGRRINAGSFLGKGSANAEKIERAIWRMIQDAKPEELVRHEYDESFSPETSLSIEL